MAPLGLFGALSAAAMIAAFGLPGASAPDAGVDAERSYADLPLAFEENAGQAPGRFDFVARSGAGSAAISSTSATIALSGKKSSEAIELGLLGASPSEPEALAKLPGEVNYLVGDDQSKWRTGLPTFERVRYAEVYPGIDLLWHGRQDALEYDFRLAPHADPGRIAMRVGGDESVRVARNGDLVIDAGHGSVRQKAPVAYQERGGERIPVDASYSLDGDVVSFDLAPYDRSRPLVIDPVVLAYSTYLGGNSDDRANAIAVDSQGAAYVTGDTFSTDFNTVGQIEGDSTGTDAFVSKLNPAGSALAYSTYLGGNSNDNPNAIAVDTEGAAYVTGDTSSTDFNTVGQIEGDSTGTDAFVSKLNPQGSVLAYSTYLGGNSTDNANAIALDTEGAAYVAGDTSSTDFNTVGQIEGDSTSADVFVSKLNPAGSALAYSTYLGGSGGDAADAIAVDSQGAAYVAGRTASTDFNTVGQIEGDGAFDDAFVSKLNPQGSALAYSTYLGGSGGDAANAIAVDSQGAAYVAGLTASTDFNTVGQIEGDGALDDAFVSKLNAQGSALAYSTYLGGSDFDAAKGIAVDAQGAAYVTGDTFSTDFNTVGEIEGNGPGTDAFVSKLNPAGSALAYSTYLGGSGDDSPNAIAVDSQGAYVAGITLSTDFNTVGAIEGDGLFTDAFISKLVAPTDLALSKSDSPDPVREGQELTYTLTVTNHGPEVALGARVVDTLPAGVTFVSASSGCANAVDTVTCQLGTIQRTQTKSVQITVRPTAAGTLINRAVASAVNSDPDAGNSSAVEETTVTSAPLCQGRNATIVGTSGSDALEGTGGPDVIVGLGDNDQIAGRDGDDLICPDAGSDTASGGSGDDEFADPASSSDTYRGGSGDDTFSVGGDPALKLSAGDGADTLTVATASTASSIDLGSGPDQVRGPLSGKVLGGGDDDLLVAHAAANGPLQGGSGDDTLQGSGAADELRGEGGGDVITGKADVDLLHGGSGNDQILAGGGSETGANAIRGGDGNDEIRGGGGADQLFGEGDDDTLLGEDDPDALSGGAGEDSCSGGGGADSADSTCETMVSVP